MHFMNPYKIKRGFWIFLKKTHLHSHVSRLRSSKPYSDSNGIIICHRSLGEPEKHQVETEKKNLKSSDSLERVVFLEEIKGFRLSKKRVSRSSDDLQNVHQIRSINIHRFFVIISSRGQFYFTAKFESFYRDDLVPLK